MRTRVNGAVEVLAELGVVFADPRYRLADGARDTGSSAQGGLMRRQQVTEVVIHRGHARGSSRIAVSAFAMNNRCSAVVVDRTGGRVELRASSPSIRS